MSKLDLVRINELRLSELQELTLKCVKELSSRTGHSCLKIGKDAEITKRKYL